MDANTLDALIRAVTTIFVLSLAVERLSSLFKGKDYQIFRTGRHKQKAGLRVNLAQSIVVHVQGEQSTPVVDPNLRQAQLRAVNNENTLFLGMLVAILTGSNAFSGLPGTEALHQIVGLQGAGWNYVFGLPGMMMTGAAAAIGSSFWYDLLGLLIEIRRTRESVHTATTAMAAPGADLTALKDKSSLFRTSREQAKKQIAAWVASGAITGGEVADTLQAPYLAVRIRLAAGKPAPATELELSVDGETVKLPVVVVA
jgi:hypothetical protein